jgi:hypothetical protein
MGSILIPQNVIHFLIYVLYCCFVLDLQDLRMISLAFLGTPFVLRADLILEKAQVSSVLADVSVLVCGADRGSFAGLEDCKLSRQGDEEGSATMLVLAILVQLAPPLCCLPLSFAIYVAGD